MTAINNQPPRTLERLTTRLSRRSLAKSGGLLAAGGLLGRAELVRTAAQSAPSVATTINALITLEAFAVTFFGAARGQSGTWGFDEAAKPFVLASQCEDEAHFNFFEAAGALSSTTTFNIPANQLESQASFLSALVRVESIFVGAYMAAARQFATMSSLRLVEIAYQIGAVEAQHLAVTRLLAGERLASDRAFVKWMFTTPAEGVSAIKRLGYMGGSGKEFTYPGPVDRYCRGVTGLVAETTEDQPPAVPEIATPEAG